MANILTNREVISNITNTLRSLNTDEHISKRFIFNKLLETTAVFVKRENDLKRLFKSSDVWTPIPCFPLEKKSPVECCLVDIPECYFIMKSKYKLPATFSGNHGNIIREVSSVLPIGKPLDLNKPLHQPMFFTPVSGAKEYRNKINREFVNPNVRYYWIEDDYIYIPDTEIEGVRIVAYFLRPWEVKSTDYCSGETTCVKPLDEPFNCPTYLYGVVQEEVIKNLANTYEKIPQDDSPDGTVHSKTLNQLVNRT